MTQLAEMPRRLSVPATDSCGNLEYFESPLLFHAGPHWYFTYVAYKQNKGSGCDKKGSYVNYIIGDSMFGPFDGPVHHLVFPAGDGNESVQQGICSYKGQLYLAYHVPYENLANPRDHHRQVSVTKLMIDSDGSLQAVYPDRDVGVGTPGVSRLTLDAFAPRREAAEFYALANVIGRKGISGEYQMKMGDGGYLLFRHMDFGHGASEFRAEIQSEDSNGGSNLLELHLDNPSGTLIGKLEISNAVRQLTILSTPLSSEIDGVHDLYLVARGTATASDRRLFSLTWFAFFPAGK